MSLYFIDMGIALWFGILTSISPCPLATNIAAVSFIGRKLDKTRFVLLAGVLYTLGRALTYVILGALIVTSAQSIPFIANFLQKYLNIILGPILIIIGILLLGLINISFGSSFGKNIQKIAEKSGLWGAGILGIVFALSFCPVSAGLFFGSLFTLAIKHSSRIIMPLLYGIGTALPVLVFALLLAFASNIVGKAFNKLTAFELWARRITAIVFIFAGVYFCLTHIFHVL